MPHRDEVPEGWWRQACEVVSHPMACVSTDNRFVWVNSAFERLTGYSRSELRDLKWMDITVQGDVGGDLASVNDVITGVSDRYALSKRYRHKLGKDIPIVLSVWRFPRSVNEVMACFIVEAVPEHASVMELERLKKELQEQIDEVKKKLPKQDYDSKEINVSYNSQSADNGGSNSNNSSSVIMVIAAIVVAGIVGLSAMFLGGVLKIETGQGTVEVEGQK